MRAVAAIAVMILSLPPWVCRAADSLTEQDRIELVRGLLSEFANAKVLVPRSKKPLEFDSTGTYDKALWSQIAQQSGPAARLGDQVQITRIAIESDRIVLELNGGFSGGKKWYRGIQMSGGMGGGGTPVPIANDPNSNAPGGTSIALLFHKPLEPIKASEIKKMLRPVLDFDKRSATEIYSETLPPEVQQSIREKRVTVGMDRDQVIMALGRPTHKSRESLDGLEVEDWVFGTPPGKITFVTFNGDKVIKVKESYAGLGTEVADPPVAR